LGDGYQEDDLCDYASHVENVISGFFAESPFDEYKSFFNVHRVDVISTDEGVRYGYVAGCDDTFVPDTALKMQFCTPWQPPQGEEITLEHLLSIGDKDAATAAANRAPDNDSVICLANSSKYGGGGYTGENIMTASARNQWRVQFVLHEFGHSFGNLGDEYFDEGSGTYTDTEEELKNNLSTYNATEMEFHETKWYRWLGAQTVPSVHGPIDTYVGGYHYEYGVYRPTDWSKMRAFVDDYDRPCPFHQVNAEQFIFKIYEEVEVVDNATPDPPAGTYYAIGTQFFVEPLQPATHSLDVTWYIVGDPEPVGTGPDFDSSTLDLPTGEYTLQVEVVDNTDMIRDESKRPKWNKQWTLGKAAHWKFNEGTGNIAYDSIGDTDGTLIGDTQWVDDFVRGWCLDFDGDWDYVALPKVDALADNSTTISAWIKADNLSEYRYPIVSTLYYEDPSYYGYLLSLKENPSGSSVYKPRFYVGYGTGAAVDSDISIDTVHWFHIAGTYDGYYLKIYVNGELNTKYASGHTGLYENYDTTYIGRDVPTSSYFDGKIDDVRVYDWVMNQSQIWEIMSSETSRFTVKDNSRVPMAWFDTFGNLFLKGSKKTEWVEPSGANNEFIFKNNSGPIVYINESGNLYLKFGNVIENTTPVSTSADEFRIKSEDGSFAAIIKADPLFPLFQNIYLKGKLYQNP
jgi:hypothetical protein